MKKEIILNFGKYKGEPLSSVSFGYLGWLLTEYKGTSLSKEDIEEEALKRGCEKREGFWGIVQERKEKWELAMGFEFRSDFFGNVITRQFNDNFDFEHDYGDPYEYEGVPNT